MHVLPISGIFFGVKSRSSPYSHRHIVEINSVFNAKWKIFCPRAFSRFLPGSLPFSTFILPRDSTTRKKNIEIGAGEEGREGGRKGGENAIFSGQIPFPRK